MHPVLFTIPGLEWEVQAYGFFLGLALVFGWMISQRLAAWDRLPAQALGGAYVFGVAAGLLAARAWWLVRHPERFEGWLALVQLQAGGLAPMFGIVVALIVTALFAGRHRVPVLAWFDCLAPAFAVGVVLEHVGAFLAGTGFGRYVSPGFPLAVRFPADSVAYAWHRRHLESLLPSGATESLSVHPVQLYGVGLGLAGLALCIVLRRRRRFSGQVVLAYATYFLAAQLFVESSFRADKGPGVLGPLGPAQLTGLVVIAGLLAVYRARAAKARSNPGALRHWTGGPWSPKEA